jgi:hypothetical protein
LIENLKHIDWISLLKRWWLSLLLIPFIIYHIHQAYWTLRFNIFFSISYSFPFPINLENFLIKNFLLIVHEAGHTFFGLLGNRTLMILGGSLNEILLPAIILGYCIFNKYTKGTQLSLYLLGSAWISVAFYAADGASRQLPLIADLGASSHDWGNLLRQWGLTDHAGTFGITFALIGVVCYISALLVPLWMKVYENVDIDLKL